MVVAPNRHCVIEYNDPAHASAAKFLSGTPLGDRNLQVDLMAPAPAPAQHAPAPGYPQHQNAQYPPQNSAAPAPYGAHSQANAHAQHAFPGQQIPGATPVLNMKALGIPDSLLQASKEHAETTARTIYVGGLNPNITEGKLEALFAACGPINFVKMGGDKIVNGITNKFAFIEFKTTDAATNAMQMTGTVVMDRPMKVGKANNPIIKANRSSSKAEQNKLAAIMERVKNATSKISTKVEKN